MKMKKIVFIIAFVCFLLENSPCYGGIGVNSNSLVGRFNPTDVTGAIVVDKAFYEGLNAIYGSATILQQGLIIEVWRVSYKDAPVQPNQTSQQVNISLLERYDAALRSVQVTLVANRYQITYQFRNIPAEGDYAVLAYYNSVPIGYGNAKLLGLGNDDSNRANLTYKSDAKFYIGVDKIWGMNSIPKSGTRLAQVDALDFTSTTSNFTSIYGFSLNPIKWVGDLFEGLKDLVFDGGKKIVGYVINAAGNVIVRVGGEVITFIQTGGFSKSRDMTQAEYDWANKIFGGTLPPRTSITLTNLRWDRNRPFVWANITGSGVTMNMGDLYDNLMSTDKSRAVFIHELTHVWQYNNRSLFNYTIEGIGNQIANSFVEEVYDYQCGKNWNDYNFERQADIVKDLYCWREYGLIPTWKYSGNDLYQIISSDYSSRYLINKSSNYLSNDPYNIPITYNNSPKNYQNYGITLFKGCLTCQEELVIKNIRFGKRFDIKQTVDDAFVGKIFNLFEGKYPISAPLRITKKMTIGTCSGAAIIGKN
jgi:hypothetical protein